MCKIKRFFLVFILPIFLLILSGCELIMMDSQLNRKFGMHINIRKEYVGFSNVGDEFSLEVGFGFRNEKESETEYLNEFWYDIAVRAISSYEKSNLNYNDIKEVFFTIYASNPNVLIEDKSFKEIINKEIPIVDDYTQISGYQYIKDIEESVCFFKEYNYKSIGNAFEQTTFNHYEFIDVPVSCCKYDNQFNLALAFYGVSENGCYLMSYTETKLECDYSEDSRGTYIYIKHNKY